MVDDIDLPVWSIRPNWKSGILERLGWLTDVMPSTYGPEQRLSLRLSPRRSFEITFNPVDRVRTFFDLFLHRMGSFDMMLPLFHDRGRLSNDLAAGALIVPVDTTYREFVEGGFAIIMGTNPFTFDKLEIISVADDALTVATETGYAWPAGSAVYPLRRAQINQESVFAALTSRVGSSVLEFQLNQANDLPDEGEWPLLYNDYPVLLDKPNWREQRDMTFVRNSLLLDGDHGLKVRQDDAGRAFTMQVHNRMIHGRAEHWAFRQFLYRLNGRQGSIWVPTFNQDVELATAHVAADDELLIKTIGYMYTGGLVSGRHHLLIADSIMREITDADPTLSATEERLTLSAALGVDLPAGTKASFMEPCRLSGDDVEIVHHTDTDGVSECNLSFRSFRDERTEDFPIEYPIPEAEMRDVECGEALPSDCPLNSYATSAFFGGELNETCPPGYTDEIYFVLPSLPDPSPTTFVYEWNIHFQISYRVDWLPPEEWPFFPFVQTRRIEEGDPEPCWLIWNWTFLGNEEGAPGGDASQPMFATRYDPATNRLYVRSWVPLRPNDGDYDVRMVIAGLQDTGGPDYSIECWQSDETAANHVMLAIESTTGPDDFIETGSGEALFTYARQWIGRADLP